MTTLTAKDVMTAEVLTAQEDWSVEQLAEFLVAHNISGAPVTAKSGKLVGVVSLTDVARHRQPAEQNIAAHYYVDELEHHYAQEEIASFRIEAESTTNLREIMTPMLFEVDERTPLPQVADTMIRGRIHRLLVTRDKQVVGIISTLDMLQVIRDL